MSNPWLKKNPFMSMWLSTANQVANTARGHATSEIKRQTRTAQSDWTRQMIDFWSGATLAPKTTKTKRRKTRR